MQFLAFLQDSFREAKSGWLLQIMLGLSLLLVLLVASVGFRPVTVNDELDYKLGILNRFASRPDNGKPQFAIENATSSNPGEPWKADYRFEFVVRADSPADMKLATESGLPVYRSEVEQFLRTDLSYLNDLTVTGGPPDLEKRPADAPRRGRGGKAKDKPNDGDKKNEAKDDDKKDEAKAAPLPKEVRYQVTTKGTKAEDQLAWRHKVSVLFFYEVPFIFISLREGLYYLEKYVVNYGAGWVVLFIGVVATAGFIPNMLTKGSLDLMVSKPIGRARLLVYKYVGGLIFVFLLTSFLVLGVWAGIGLRNGLWPVGFLSAIPITTFAFAVLYAFSTLAAVLSRHTLVAILITMLAWGGLWAVGKVNDGIETRRAAEAKLADAPAGSPQAMTRDIQAEQPLWGFIPRSTFPVLTALHAVTPRTYEMDDRLGRIIAEGLLTPNQLKEREYDQPARTSWAEMVAVSLFGIAVLLGLACWRFSSRDY